LSVLQPGIIARLSHLIVIQVVFVFGALALILFVPGSDSQSTARLNSLGRDLAKSAEHVSELLRATDLVPEDRGEGEEVIIRSILDSCPIIDRAAVVRFTDTGRIDFVLVHRRAGTDPSEGDGDVSGFVDLAMLENLSAGGLCLPQPLLDTRYLAYYEFVNCDSGRPPTILVAASDHGLAISARSSLQYAVFVLFLCSALVSLLTVSLLLRKFKRPLDKIIAGLEETAEGKLHPLADLETDPELGRLARAYNAMARRLWSHRQQLDHYFVQMQSANAELKESQSFLRTLIDSTPLGVVVTDTAGRIILFNRAAGVEFGYVTAEAVDLQFHDLLAEKLDRPAASVDLEGRDGFEVICRRKNGDLFPAYIITSEVRADDGSYLANLYVCRNITETRDFQEMMIRLDRYYTRGEMAGDIAHEINNYLAVLMGNVELFPRLLQKGDPEHITRKLGVMHTALQNIACLSDGLLDSPTDTVRLEPASISQIVESVISFLKPQNKFDTVEVTTEVGTDLPVVYVDTAQVQQLLVNLIYNAAEALSDQPGQRHVRVAVSPSDVESGPAVKIVVSDNGPGVASDKEHLLFKSRFTTKRRGHGIGLITCRKIADNHGGTITYDRRGGAVFSVELPVGSLPTEETEQLTGAENPYQQSTARN
jgi:two-component system sensor kinase FixL